MSETPKISKIQRIKQIRAENPGMDLKEAKDIADAEFGDAPLEMTEEDRIDDEFYMLEAYRAACEFEKAAAVGSIDLLNLSPAQRRLLPPDDQRVVTRVKYSRTQILHLQDEMRQLVRSTDQASDAGREVREHRERTAHLVVDFYRVAVSVLETVAENLEARMSEMEED